MDARDEVRDAYGAIARGGEDDCCEPVCCGAARPEDHALRIGYTPEQLEKIPTDANLGLGCGNPTAIAGLEPGETVVDLGSGAGMDCFLAAQGVGEGGRVIGVDMTAEMVSQARRVAAESGRDHVEFRLGEIEHLPIEDGAADVILSNCVINLSPDKAKVVAEMFRVLAPGGRVAVSDIVATAPIPDDVAEDLRAQVGCVAGATPLDAFRAMLEEVGFVDVDVQIDPEAATIVDAWIDGASEYVAPARIRARKPE